MKPPKKISVKPQPRSMLILKTSLKSSEEHDPALDKLKADALKLIMHSGKAKTAEDLVSSPYQTSSSGPSSVKHKRTKSAGDVPLREYITEFEATEQEYQDKHDHPETELWFGPDYDESKAFDPIHKLFETDLPQYVQDPPPPPPEHDPYEPDEGFLSDAEDEDIDVRQRGKQTVDQQFFSRRHQMPRSDVSISYAQPSPTQPISERKATLRRPYAKVDLGGQTYDYLCPKHGRTTAEPSEAMIRYTGRIHDDSLDVSYYDPSIARSMLESKQDTDTAIGSQSSRVPSFPSDVIPQPVYSSGYGGQNIDAEMTRESMIRQTPRITIRSGMKPIKEQTWDEFKQFYIEEYGVQTALLKEIQQSN